MMNFTRRVFAVLLSLLIGVVAVTPSFASAQQSDETAVRTAVRDLARFRADDNTNALYDRLAPEVRNQVPRSTWHAWYELTNDFVPVGSPQIDAIDFETWTSPSGEAYDDVAVVEVTQAGERDSDDVSEDETFYFIEVDDRWRWIPEIDPEDVVDTVDDADVLLDYDSDFRGTSADIDTFWAMTFADAGLEYHAPDGVVAVTRNSQIFRGCGTAKDVVDIGVFYCTLDETIYYDPDFQDYLIDALGDSVWDIVIAHEWGHHVQQLLGLDYSSNPELDGGYYTIELEQQADCMAGIFLQNWTAIGDADDDNLRVGLTIMNAIGDPSGSAWDDVLAHGDGDMRQEAFLNGFDNGFSGCRMTLED